MSRTEKRPRRVGSAGALVCSDDRTVTEREDDTMEFTTPRDALIEQRTWSRLVDRLADGEGYSPRHREKLDDMEALGLIRRAARARVEQDLADVGSLSAACREVIARHRWRAGRAVSAVEGAGWAAPDQTKDEGAAGAVVEARDLIRADLGLAIEDGRSALVRAEDAIKAGDAERAARHIEQADTMLAQVREIREIVDGILLRAQVEIDRQSWQLWDAQLTPLVIADAAGTWTRSQGFVPWRG